MNKKSQSGSKAAMLVAIIMGLIILYILFLPPSERERLLYNQTVNETSETGGTTEGNITLLLEHPMLLEYLPTTEYEKSIPSFSLYIKTGSAVVKKQDFITVKNSWFATQTYEMIFPVSDLKNSDNFMLNFNLDKAQGNLMVKLNDKLIYDKEIKEANVVINLDKSDIKDQNKLVFSVSSVGIKFWSTNAYELSNVQVLADITDITKQASKTNFIISSTEINNLDQSTARFYVSCDKKLELDKLEVSINNHLIYSQLPLCGDYVQQEFDPAILISGENSMEFRTKFAGPTTAYYTLDNLLVKLKLKEPVYPTYYFDLSSKRFDKITQGTKKIKLRMLFTDDFESKRAELRINGIKTSLDTTKKEFIKDLSDFVKQDNNAIKIIPSANLEIIDLKVTYE